jgi:hypothetical protein
MKIGMIAIIKILDITFLLSHFLMTNATNGFLFLITYLYTFHFL